MLLLEHTVFYLFESTCFVLEMTILMFREEAANTVLAQKSNGRASNFYSTHQYTVCIANI